MTLEKELMKVIKNRFFADFLGDKTSDFDPISALILG
jgi:hypothetical protein